MQGRGHEGFCSPEGIADESAASGRRLFDGPAGWEGPWPLQPRPEPRRLASWRGRLSTSVPRGGSSRRGSPPFRPRALLPFALSAARGHLSNLARSSLIPISIIIPSLSSSPAALNPTYTYGKRPDVATSGGAAGIMKRLECKGECRAEGTRGSAPPRELLTRARRAEGTSSFDGPAGREGPWPLQPRPAPRRWASRRGPPHPHPHPPPSRTPPLRSLCRPGDTSPTSHTLLSLFPFIIIIPALSSSPAALNPTYTYGKRPESPTHGGAAGAAAATRAGGGTPPPAPPGPPGFATWVPAADAATPPAGDTLAPGGRKGHPLATYGHHGHRASLLTARLPSVGDGLGAVGSPKAGGGGAPPPAVPAARV